MQEAQHLLVEAYPLAKGVSLAELKEEVGAASLLFEEGLLEAKTLSRLYFGMAFLLAQETLSLLERGEEEEASRRLAEAKLYWRAAWGLLSVP